MSVINFIPNYEEQKSPIPTPGVEPLLENDVRLDKLMAYYLEHVDIIVLEEESWGSTWWFEDILGSSSTSPIYPMADVEVVPAIGNTDVINHWLDSMELNHLPGTLSGPYMTSRNFLTMSSHVNVEVPGDIEDETSSSA